MDDRVLDGYIQRGKTLTIDSPTIYMDELGMELVVMWNVIGEIGERVRKMEDSNGS